MALVYEMTLNVVCKAYLPGVSFTVKVGGKNIFKPIIGQESLHQRVNDNGVKLVNFATSKNLVALCSRHWNIHKVPVPPLTVRLTTRLSTY